MTTGYNIIIGGREFEPNAAIYGTVLTPSVICEKGDDGFSEEYGRGAFVEFSDFHDDPYPLDMMSEAMNFIRTHLRALYDVTHYENVEYRNLNFIDDARTGGLFILPSDDMAMLAALKLELNINVVNVKEDDQADEQ